MKQKIVALSFTKSKYKAVSQVATKIAWLRSLLGEIHIPFYNPIVVCYDNVNAGALASNSGFHSRTKHIEIDVHFIKRASDC